MKITKSYDISYNVIDEIYAEGTIQIHGVWADIETEVKVYKKTNKAYFGSVTVHIVLGGQWGATKFHKDNTWIPKSMSQNPYWICTVMFGHPEKVSNKRFEEDTFW